jgi:hypothetical protein
LSHDVVTERQTISGFRQDVGGGQLLDRCQQDRRGHVEHLRDIVEAEGPAEDGAHSGGAARLGCEPVQPLQHRVANAIRQAALAQGCGLPLDLHETFLREPAKKLDKVVRHTIDTRHEFGQRAIGVGVQHVGDDGRDGVYI